MAYQTVAVSSVSFCPEGSDGSAHLLVENTVVSVDQMQSEHESARIEVSIELAPDYDGSKTLTASRVSVRLVLNDGRICVFPRCIYKVEPPQAGFTAQDVKGKGKSFWAIVEGERIIGNKKIDFPAND